MTLQEVRFEGHECVRLGDEATAVVVTTSVGPRVLSLTGRSGNLLAVLPDGVLERPDGTRYRLYGGHRLWAGPEVLEVTYEPDDLPCEVTEVEAGVRVQAPEDGVGFAKTIEIRRTAQGWTVDHTIRNGSAKAVAIAPWAITQLRTGGEAIMPAEPRGSGLQADRSLVVWSYTDLADPRIAFERNAVRIRATPTGPALKLGLAPSDGTVAYRLDGEVFEKRFDVDPDAEHVDRGAAVQVYLCDEFCELETLGPLRVLEPGEATTHRERWSLRSDGSGGGER